MTLALHGLGVSRGIGVGKAYVLSRAWLNIVEYRVAEAEIDTEVERFLAALDQARTELQQLRDEIPVLTSPEIRSFLDTHILMLADAAFAQVPIDIIRIRRCNAEWALKLQRDSLVKVFEDMADPYLRTRQDDVDYVINGIQRMLLTATPQGAPAAQASLRGAIVLADDLSPADTMRMHNQGIAGFVTEFGGATSHTAILARSFGIPALVGVHNARRQVQAGETLVVDGWQGVLYAGADPNAIDFFRQRQQREAEEWQALESLVGQTAVTADGQRIQLQANVEMPDDLIVVERVAADGIGLLRTEMIFLNRDEPPDEEEQLGVYARALAAAGGAPVTIRSLDIGADKTVSWMAAADNNVTNPALSLRGIRWCLKEVGIFRTQLRAIMRAAAQGPVRLMLPMLSNVNEVFQVRQLLADLAQELAAEELPHDANLPLGGMVEVPAAAVMADVFARHLDFLSIGTNDLIQYTLAADRIDDSVSYLYDPLHPAVLRLIQMTIQAGRNANIPVAMCGEMAGDARYTRLLLGLGLRNFSMHPAFLLEIKRIVTQSHLEPLIKAVNAVLTAADPESFSRLMTVLNAEA